ncbi:uncharacterized protein BX664DRAFT_346612 [Halteromyces radiatus]|uniref:uncharacterized protein n=1 Tax=Halteromyces radiatus TaxID=101107 RepID=UPI00221EF102|nr:uncharacterized protein BX664DRAFT_346612 [Halteromyces radiatus]KAI8096557.1 hypothetical protein BX664DRAFT_346612 [Halteromyces radiatus]
MFPPCHILPATCELCGNWLPDHQASCPRNGVHPSQWTMDIFDPLVQDQQEDELFSVVQPTVLSCVSPSP